MASGLSNERVLKKLLEQMNAALPSKRPWLSELLVKAEPSYTGRDGTEYVIDRTELVLIEEALRVYGLRDVRIPILLFSDTGHEQSAWRVEGLEECAVISHVLGRTDPGVRSPMFLHLAHMFVIRRELPTATVGVYA